MSDGFDIVDTFEIDDLSDQSGGDLLPAVRRVQFTVKDAKVNEIRRKDDNEFVMNKLNIQAQIGAVGVDGEGKYKNKIIFEEFIATYNTEKYTSDWWKKQARFPLKAFLQSLEYDLKGLKVNDEFLNGIRGKEFIADIVVSPIKVKDESGNYIDTGDKKNELKNFKKAN